MGIITKIFGTRSEREVKKLTPTIDAIEALSDKYAAMSEDELRGTTAVLKARLAKGETLDDLIPDAFAAVREASWRVLEKKHYRVQLIGGLILHQGRIAEMKTGEGKTLMATLPCYLNALKGEGVHVVTVNDYLARRDSEWMGKVYNYLGMTVGLVVHGKTPEERKEAYKADITYGTNNEFGFDYLRDNMAVTKSGLVQRGHAFAIVDEVDSILIDEARTPLIISGMGEASTDLYRKADKFVRTLTVKVIKELDSKEDNENIGGDYIVDEKARKAVLTASGVAKAEKYFGLENLSDPENQTIAHHINQAINAHGVMKNDIDYVVRDGEVLIVDQFTGRIMMGRRYSNGLHQAIEAKEGVEIKNESKTLATITFQNYFRLYKKLSGMTGTALTEEDEFREIYNLDVVEVPTNRPMIRKDYNDAVYVNEAAKYRAVVEQIKECHAKGQPVLVGTVSIEKSEFLSGILKKQGVPHNVLNAKYHEKEAEIVAQAGKFGAVTISTNMAGRGTDIMLGGNAEFMAKQEMRKNGRTEEEISLATSYFATDDENIIALRKEFADNEEKFSQITKPEAKRVADVGGLFIIGTERHESRRIDNQLRGRAGRQGDPGCSRFYLSLEDDLLRLFGGEMTQNFATKANYDENVPLDLGIISSVVERAQKRIEGENFNRRKHVLMYDDVMNKQRGFIYGQRQEVLEGKDVHDNIMSMIDGTIENIVKAYMPSDIPEEWNLEALRSEFLNLITTDDDFRYNSEEINAVTPEKIEDELIERAHKKIADNMAIIPEDYYKGLERKILLRCVDTKWIEHIDAMDDLRGGIGLRAFASKDPVKEYTREGNEMFDEMVGAIREDTAKMILGITVATKQVEQKDIAKDAKEGFSSDAAPKRISAPGASGGNVYGSAAKPEARKEPVRRSAAESIGRNDPCPCGSGKKYKKCCGAPKSGEKSEDDE